MLMTVVTLVTYWNRRRVCRSSHVSTMDVGSMSPVNLTGYLYWSNAASCRIAHEWTVIPHMICTGILDKVKQLAVELHFHVGKQPPEHVRKCMRIIRHLEEYGMIRFASRANYYALNYVMGKLRHNIFELVWYNRKFLK